jgi:hypothetical protein
MFPLKQSILISTNTGDYLCKISYAGENIINAVDVFKRHVKIEEDSVCIYYSFCAEKMIFDRNKVSGYTRKELDKKFVRLPKGENK